MEGTEDAREALVEHLREEGALRSPAVERALAAVPREEFVPDSVRHRAYEDVPLDIGEGQVVTAPHLVARMTELLEPAPGRTVLEIGTGSGYHAAVVAEIVGAGNVVTVERHPVLANAARRALERTGYGDVRMVVGDGSKGLPDDVPYDRINVACAAPDIPRPLVDRLADGGRMVIPVGPREGTQTLELVEKRDGRIERTPCGPVRFVPLVGDDGFEPPS